VVTLATHDSFVVKPEVLEEFQKSSGITVKQIANGDAGELTNKLVLTKANPIGDVAFGVDSTFASRALAEGVFAEYASPEATKGAQRYKADDSNRLQAVDVGDVCLNIDPSKLGGTEPASYEDLTDPKFKDKLVVENPATSSPGYAADYSWLTGQLEYSRFDKGWRVRYCGPGEEDRLGGAVTIMAQGVMDDPQEDQVVTVYGRLVEGTNRAPIYRVDSYRVVQAAPNK
jgi:ABC transporter substrate-binding protein (ThiB subfamily)